jgi:hypothetical protein
MRILATVAFCGSIFAGLISVAAAKEMSKEEIIANAESAAPAAIGKHATIATFDDKMALVILRKGTNNFTCNPDDPTTPANDPQCVDENGLAWTIAFMTKKPPPEGKIGFGYMLQGEAAQSNVDPFAPPPADGKWHTAGPHIMILNAKATMPGYPRSGGENPDVSQPWVMWPGTPYEHLMIPVPAE